MIQQMYFTKYRSYIDLDLLFYSSSLKEHASGQRIMLAGFAPSRQKEVEQSAMFVRDITSFMTQ